MAIINSLFPLPWSWYKCWMLLFISRVSWNSNFSKFSHFVYHTFLSMYSFFAGSILSQYDPADLPNILSRYLTWTLFSNKLAPSTLYLFCSSWCCLHLKWFFPILTCPNYFQGQSSTLMLYSYVAFLLSLAVISQWLSARFNLPPNTQPCIVDTLHLSLLLDCMKLVCSN